MLKKSPTSSLLARSRPISSAMSSLVRRKRGRCPSPLRVEVPLPEVDPSPSREVLATVLTSLLGSLLFQRSQIPAPVHTLCGDVEGAAQEEEEEDKDGAEDGPSREGGAAEGESARARVKRRAREHRRSKLKGRYLKEAAEFMEKFR